MSKRIMIVEDDDAIREALSAFLQLEGHKPYEARHGQEALENLEASSMLPDLILLDIKMPVMDGYRFRELQKADARFDSIPVIAMSAHANIESGENRLEFFGRIKKPLNLDKLLNLIQEAPSRPQAALDN